MNFCDACDIVFFFFFFFLGGGGGGWGGGGGEGGGGYTFFFIQLLNIFELVKIICHCHGRQGPLYPA